MPIYVYRCTHCGLEKEVLQKISEAPLVDCPSCEQPSLIKQVTAAGFQLKGSGWYVTDFKENKSKKNDQSKTETSVATETEKSSPDSSSSAVDKAVSS